MKGYKVPEHMIDGLKNWIDRFPSDDKYAWGMNAIVDEIESLPLEELDDTWHTGTPTEAGLYVIAFRFGNKIEHEIREMFYSPDYGMTFGIKKDIVAYQKIEPFEASTSHAGFCNTEGCSNSKTDMSKAQNHICPYYYQGVCSLDEDICCRQHLYEICDKFIEASEGRNK